MQFMRPTYCVEYLKYLNLYVPLAEGPRPPGETQRRDAENGGKAAGGEDGKRESGGGTWERKGLQPSKKDCQ